MGKQGEEVHILVALKCREFSPACVARVSQLHVTFSCARIKGVEEMTRQMPALLCSEDWRTGRWMVGSQSFGHSSISFNQSVGQSSGNRVCQPRGGSVS